MTAAVPDRLFEWTDRALTTAIPAATREWVEVSAATEPVRFLIRASTGDYYMGVLEAENDPGFAGYYNAEVWGFPGCISFGDSIASAKRNLREALELYISS